MAILDLRVTIPDAQVARFQAAMRETFGQVEDGLGGVRDMTNAEIIARLKAEVIGRLKERVRNAERTFAARIFEASEPPFDAS